MRFFILMLFALYASILCAKEIEIWLINDGKYELLGREGIDNASSEESTLEIALPAKNGEPPQILRIKISKESAKKEQGSSQESTLSSALKSGLDSYALPQESTQSAEDSSQSSAHIFPRIYRLYENRRRLFGEFLGVIPHRQNYLLPLSHSLNTRKNEKRSESKFQISFKTLLASDIFGSKLDLYGAYTQKSYWQVYNSEESRPFRESNYEPELFLSYPAEIPLFGGALEQVNFGINHESNGGNVEKSRSWNRLFLEGIYNRGNLFVALKGWYRIPDREKSSPLDSSGDDNPDIHDYLGYGELRLGYLFGWHLFSASIRNNMRPSAQNRGSILIDYSYPLQSNLFLYLQYFSGYGESLIDYDRSVERVGAGFLFTR